MEEKEIKAPPAAAEVESPAGEESGEEEQGLVFPHRFKLQAPIKFGKETIAELVFQKPTGKHFRSLPARPSTGNYLDIGMQIALRPQLVGNMLCTGDTFAVSRFVQELIPEIEEMQASAKLDNGKLLRLEEALELEDGEKLEVLNFRTPKGKDWRDFPVFPVMGDLLNVAARITGREPKDMNELSLRDTFRVGEVIGNFIRRGR
jgi:hypothetical protein